MIDLVNGELMQVAASSGGGGKTMKMQEFTSSGTWVRPAGVDVIHAEWGGAGGGGAGGARFGSLNSYYSNTNDYISLKGGSGGAGRVRSEWLPVTGDLTIAIGAGGFGAYGFVTPTNYDAVVTAMGISTSYSRICGQDGGDTMVGTSIAEGGGGGSSIGGGRSFASWDGAALSTVSSPSYRPNGTWTASIEGVNGANATDVDSQFWRMGSDVFQEDHWAPMVTATRRGMSGYNRPEKGGGSKDEYYKYCAVSKEPHSNRAFYYVSSSLFGVYDMNSGSSAVLVNGWNGAYGCGGGGASAFGRVSKPSIGSYTSSFYMASPLKGGSGGDGFCRITWWE